MNQLTRLIGFVLLIGLMLLQQTTATEQFKKKPDDEKPIIESSSVKKNDASELGLLALHEDLLGESISSTSSLPLPIKPSSSIPDKEISTTSQPLKPSSSLPSSPVPSSPSPSLTSLPTFSIKPTTSADSTTSNLLTGEEDFDNNSNSYSDDDQNDANESPQPPRKLITFDQRQEGQYNIRADLDNFMIVVIPPNPTAGISLLDLLTRSSSKRTNTKKSNKKHYHYGSASGSGSDAYDSIKSNHYPSERSKNNQHISYLSKILQSNQNSIGNSGGGGSNDNQIFDFIEGRTPYRVDISSNIGSPVQDYNPAEKLYQNSINGLTTISNSNSGSDSGQQIDVIPPPYPIKYQQHLMKPYHLEIEPHVVQIPVQHSTAAHAIPPQVPTNIYNPSSGSSAGSISQQQQQQQQSQQKKQEQNQRSFLNGGGFNPASVARGNFLDFFTHFTNGIPGIPGSTSSSILLPNTNSRSFYSSDSTNPTSTYSFNTNHQQNNNKNNNLSRRYAKSIRDSLIYLPDPDLNLIQYNNVLRGDGGNNIYNTNNILEKRDSTIIKRDIPTTKQKLPTFFGISLNSNDPTLYPPLSYHRIIMNSPQDLYANIGNRIVNNNNYGVIDDNLNDYDDSNIDVQQNNIEEIIKRSDLIENNGTGFNNNIELKLIGATEQCGPDSVRDSYGVCRLISSF